MSAGTVTLLFTDIEGSTRLLHQLGDDYAVLLSDHRRILRSAFQAHGGREVDTQGDSFFVVFEEAQAAVAAAADSQSALDSHRWPRDVELRVRMGLHSGEPMEISEGYVGVDVHRAARISAAAHGGQVVMSRETAERLHDGDGQRDRLRELGPHSLKDLPEPEQLFQLLVAGMPSDFPPLQQHKEAPAAARLPDYSLAPADVPCPYKGLAAFEPEDDSFFFGREELVEELLVRLAEFPFLAVVGPSGSGKSSLVRAGLLPGLERRGRLSERGKELLITPGEHPLEALAAGDFEALVVDQFEEVFTLCQDEEERRLFIEALLSASGSEDGRIVVIALRADFYGHCAFHPALAAALERYQALVGPMAEEELRRAIERPAERAGLTLEPGLVQAVLRDVVGEPGALPLLSHSLLETWKRRSGTLLSLIGYLQAGGVQGAIAKTAENVFLEELTPEQQRIARSVFLRLSALGEGTEDTRRRVLRSELILRAEDAGKVEAVLATLTDARLITGDDQTVEVAHEALIRHWPRLRRWLDEGREGHRVHRQLTEASQEWLGLGREPGSLYRGVRLGTAVEWAEQHEAELNDLEREFLERSREAEASELEESRRRNRRLRVLAGGLGLLVLAAAGLAVLAIRQTSRAEEQGRVALSRALAGQADAQLGRRLDQALLLALEAYRNERTPEARSALLAAVQRTRGFEAIMGGQHELATSVAVSADGKTIASGGADGEVVIWSVARRRPVAPAVRVGSDVRSLAFSPEGELLAVGTEAAAVALVDVASGATEGSLDGHDGPVTSVVFDSRERLRSASGFDGRVLLWDVAGLRPVADDVRLAGNTTGPAAMAPDGETVAAALQGGRFLLADARTGRVVAKPKNGPVNVEALSFSPDGRAVATGDGAGRVSVWDSGGRRQRPLGLHPRPVRAVAFSPDGRTVVSAGADGQIRVWDIATRQITREPRPGHAAGARAIAYAPDGDFVATAGLDGAVIVWRIKGGGAPERTLAPSPDSTSLSLSSDSRTVALGRADGSVLVRRLSDGRQLGAPLEGHRGDAWVSFSPNRPSVLVVADDGGAARLWDVSAQRLLRRPLRSFGRGLGQAALSPDERTLAAAGYDGELTLWNLRVPGSRPTVLPAHKGPLGELAFSPDGASIATVGDDRSLQLWDVARRRRLGKPLRGHSGPVWNVAFSPDGKWIATGGEDGTARLWDARARRPLGRTVRAGRRRNHRGGLQPGQPHARRGGPQRPHVLGGAFASQPRPQAAGRGRPRMGRVHAGRTGLRGARTTVHQPLRSDALERRPWPAARARLRTREPRPDPRRMGAFPTWGGLSPNL